jgi:hypothetical protein
VITDQSNNWNLMIDTNNYEAQEEETLKEVIIKYIKYIKYIFNKLFPFLSLKRFNN